MKSFRLQLLLASILISFSVSGSVSFRFSPGTIGEGALKNRMEENISAVLTEIDRAGRTGTALNLTGVSMEPGAKNRLTALWGDARFTCDRSENVSKCLNDMQGYQVRAIPITMKPVDSSYDGSLNRELTLSLNKSGVITGIRLAWETQEDISKILTSPGGVADTRQRREILKWVEDFRCYYNERNIKALNQIYSDDALIITGSVVQTRRNGDGVQMDGTVKYKVQNKTQYLTALERLFRNTRRINVEFDHISVMMHGAKPNIYGVTLHQKWRTSGYCDDGWLFLLWDFNDPENPQIHVRTWQDEPAVAKDGKFTLDDFFIP